jgi:SWI/SNF-related matrix-associated actin-dependent regulator 1 of chromatin subfamily A
LPLSTTTTRQAAAAKGVRCLRIDGATPASERQALVQTFQAIKPGTPAIFALSILAAGQGLTLTAAHTVVFGELRWVPGELLQAEARQLVERVLHPV